MDTGQDDGDAAAEDVDGVMTGGFEISRFDLVLLQMIAEVRISLGHDDDGSETVAHAAFVARQQARVRPPHPSLSFSQRRRLLMARVDAEAVVMAGIADKTA